MIYKIKKLRIEQGLSQEEFAKKSGVNRTIISQLENGQEVNVTIKTLEKMADCLKVPLNELYE